MKVKFNERIIFVELVGNDSYLMFTGVGFHKASVFLCVFCSLFSLLLIALMSKAHNFTPLNVIIN